LTDIYLYFFAGSLSGFLSSTPLGPINLWVADHGLSKAAPSRLWFFLGAVIVVDIIYSGAALWGHFGFLEEATELRWVGIFSGLFTLGLGAALFFKAWRDAPAYSVERASSNISAAIQGAILTGANPAFLLFWLFIANQIIARIDRSLSTIELMTFVSGVAIGDLLWFSIFIWITGHLGKKAGKNHLKYFRMIVGLIFFAIGLYATGSYVL
jgi:threonine/homoserine/homoserine lactone efflux protein